MHYLEGLETIFNCDPTNALINGLALHKGMETDVETAIDEFLNSYPVVTDELINESIKIRLILQKQN